MTIQKRFCFLLFPALLIFFVSCGIPKSFKEMADRTKHDLEAAEIEIASLKKGYADFQKTDEYRSEFKIYAERENWSDNFKKSSDELMHAKQIYSDEVSPIIKQDKKEEVSQLLRQLGRVKESIKTARLLAIKTDQRIQTIREAKKMAPQMIKKAEEITGSTNTRFSSLSDVAEKTKNLHPDKKADVETQFDQFIKLHDDSDSALKVAQAELKKDHPDYARFTDSCSLISSNYDTMQKSGAQFSSRQKELDTDYSKILDDMRAVYQVQIGRTSWDENSDSNTDHDYVYSPVTVDQQTYEYFGKLGEKEIAKISRFFGEKKEPLIDSGMWGKLKIDWKKDWPSSFDDNAVYWINDMPIVYQHRYVYVKDDTRTTGDWENVSEDFFYNHIDDLGMTLVSKPVGYYESEVIKQAAPPGMAMVGNPKYGQWKKDPKTGGSFWAFYGRYMFWNNILGGNRYYYNDWNDWNSNYRGRKPYYGHTDQWGSYGRYARTRYRDRYAFKSGVIKVEKPGIRSAGVRGRGRGPGKGK
jgi:hypothetical protein